MTSDPKKAAFAFAEEFCDPLEPNPSNDGDRGYRADQRREATNTLALALEPMLRAFAKSMVPRAIRSSGTHTYALLPVSERTFKEVADLLKEAGYDHAFDEQMDDSIVIDMHGIALSLDPTEVYERMRKSQSEPTEEQLAAGCDCQAPNGQFVQLISNYCTVHNDEPLPRPGGKA